MSRLESLLSELGLEQYLDLFVDNDIDDSLLTDLTLDDLKEIGVGSLGHRKKILAEISAQATEANAEAGTAKPAAVAAPIAERREVTTLFADLTSYTRLSRELETEDLHKILSVFYDHFDEIVKRLGGSVERHIGDCVMAVFGAPISYGNDAEHALRASLEMHRAMVDMSYRFNRNLSVHVGVASGNVLFSSQGRGALKDLDFSLTGDSVNLASRLADQAEGGQTLITSAILKNLGEQIECDLPDELNVKGFDEPISVHRFLGFADRMGDRPLIGREEEQASFDQALVGTRTSGSGGVFAVVADAGLGKSTLVEQFEHAAASHGFEVHKSLVLDFGLADHQVPVREVLGGICGIDFDDSLEQVLETLEQEAWTDEQTIIFLTMLLGGDLNERQQLLFEAMGDEVRFDLQRQTIARTLEHFASQKPLLIVVEDLHWADRETLDQIALIAAATSEAPVQLVVTLRPENDPIDDAWLELAGQPPLTRLLLKPLDAEDALKLAQRLTDPPGEEMIRACIARAEGNPLFLDQLLRHARDEGGATVPGSIQSIVQSKLDRLQMVDRTVLEAAAVIGQRFSLVDVSAIAELDSLDATPLVDAALIRSIQKGYLFSHALIRDAVLRTILRDQLHALHLRAAERFKGVDLVLYAEHLAAAQHGDAGQAFLDAARQALGRYRKELTLTLTERGLEQESGTTVRIELLILKGEMLRDLGRGREALQAYEQLLKMAVEPQDQCRAKIGMVATMRILDRMTDALGLLDETEALATAAGLDLELSEIHYYRGSLFFPMGNLDGCLAEHTLSLQYADKVGHPERRALALSGLGDAHYARGKMFTAHSVIEQCLDVSQEHQLVAVEAANRFMLATVKIYLNETTRALAEARASSELAVRVGASRAEIVSRLTTGWIYASMNELVEAEREISRGLDIAGELGAKRFEPFLEETLADVALSQGDFARAESIAEGALAKLRELDAMSFIGPWVLSTAARATSVVNRRAALLAEGEMLLEKGCVGHNYYRFYKNAIDACLDAGEWQEARRFCDCLESYTSEEPNPWSDYFVARGRTIADAAEGRGDVEQLQSLILVGGDASLMASMSRLSTALEDLDSTI